MQSAFLEDCERQGVTLHDEFIKDWQVFQGGSYCDSEIFSRTISRLVGDSGRLATPVVQLVDRAIEATPPIISSSAYSGLRRLCNSSVPGHYRYATMATFNASQKALGRCARAEEYLHAAFNLMRRQVDARENGSDGWSAAEVASSVVIVINEQHTPVMVVKRGREPTGMLTVGVRLVDPRIPSLGDGGRSSLYLPAGSLVAPFISRSGYADIIRTEDGKPTAFPGSQVRTLSTSEIAEISFLRLTGYTVPPRWRTNNMRKGIGRVTLGDVVRLTEMTTASIVQ